ncbi:MAG: hypothetical protein K9N23_16175 [Akkermansiaceae bacterium]|nr:hypothetical protein [Akkermansiaceae bacterium]
MDIAGHQLELGSGIGIDEQEPRLSGSGGMGKLAGEAIVANMLGGDGITRRGRRGILFGVELRLAAGHPQGRPPNVEDGGGGDHLVVVERSGGAGHAGGRGSGQGRAIIPNQGGFVELTVSGQGVCRRARIRSRQVNADVVVAIRTSGVGEDDRILSESDRAIRVGRGVRVLINSQIEIRITGPGAAESDLEAFGIGWHRHIVIRPCSGSEVADLTSPVVGDRRVGSVGHGGQRQQQAERTGGSIDEWGDHFHTGVRIGMANMI